MIRYYFSIVSHTYSFFHAVYKSVNSSDSKDDQGSAVDNTDGNAGTVLILSCIIVVYHPTATVLQHCIIINCGCYMYCYIIQVQVAVAVRDSWVSILPSSSRTHRRYVLFYALCILVCVVRKHDFLDSRFTKVIHALNPFHISRPVHCITHNHIPFDCTPFYSTTLQATKFKLRAELWKRQSIEDGGLFIKYFAVLEKGRLDFYSREKVRVCGVDEM